MHPLLHPNGERPIGDLLRDIGLGHRATEEEYGAREVFDLETGERFAIMTAADAVTYLQSQGVL